MAQETKEDAAHPSVTLDEVRSKLYAKPKRVRGKKHVDTNGMGLLEIVDLVKKHRTQLDEKPKEKWTVGEYEWHLGWLATLMWIDPIVQTWDDIFDFFPEDQIQIMLSGYACVVATAAKELYGLSRCEGLALAAEIRTRDWVRYDCPTQRKPKKEKKNVK